MSITLSIGLKVGNLRRSEEEEEEREREIEREGGIDEVLMRERRIFLILFILPVRVIGRECVSEKLRLRVNGRFH